jgi:acetoin utilization protein AcuB
MMLVREVMHAEPVSIGPDTSLEDAYAIMQERHIRHLPIVAAGGVVGVVTDRDLRLATSRLATRPFPPEAAVRTVMAHPVQTAHPLDPIESAARVMRELKIGCLPVLDGGRLVGIVTGVDILDALLKLTGVERPSGRLEVRLADQPGELARLTHFLAELRVNIHSVLSYPDAEHRGRTVLRVGTMDIRALADGLCAAGFEVLWPPCKPCRE